MLVIHWSHHALIPLPRDLPEGLTIQALRHPLMPNCLEKFQVSVQDQKIYQKWRTYKIPTLHHFSQPHSAKQWLGSQEFSNGHSAAKRNQRRLNDLNCTCWWCPSLQVLLALVQWGALPSSLAMSQCWFSDGRGGLTVQDIWLLNLLLDIVSTSSTVVSICLKWHYSVWHQHQQIVCPIKTLLAGMFKTSHLTKQEYSMTGRPSPLKVDTGAASETALHDFLTSAEDARRSLDGCVCKWGLSFMIMFWFITGFVMIYNDLSLVLGGQTRFLLVIWGKALDFFLFFSSMALRILSFSFSFCRFSCWAEGRQSGWLLCKYLRKAQKCRRTADSD